MSAIPLARAVLGCVTAGVLALAGCTTGSSPRPAPTDAAATTPAAPAPTAADTPPSLPESTAASTPAPPSTPGRSTSTAPTSGNTCTDLTIRVLQGGATPGREIAAVTFVNDSAAACSLSGYPAVVLRRGGTLLTTATPTPNTVAQAVRLAPGDQAQALITDISTCDAQLSDTIEVTAPNGPDGGKLTRPFTLRGCTVHVDPVRVGS